MWSWNAKCFLPAKNKRSTMEVNAMVEFLYYLPQFACYSPQFWFFKHPGPEFPCRHCDLEVQWDQTGVCCDDCQNWYHTNCKNINSVVYEVLGMWNKKEVMHCHCGTNNIAPRWTFTNRCKPEERPGAREESAYPAWLAAPAMNARDITKVYIWRLDTGCWPTLYRKCHSHNTPGKRHNHIWVEPLAGNCT